MTIPSSRSLILWISVFSITSTSADFGRLRKTSEIFGNDRVVCKNPSTPRKKSHAYNSEKVGRYNMWECRVIHHSEVAGPTSHVRTKILLLLSTVQVDWSFPYFMYNCSICTGVVGFQQELSFQVYYCIVFESLVVLEKKCPVTSNM